MWLGVVNKNYSKDCLCFGGKNELGVDVANSYFSLSFSLATQGRSQLKNKLDLFWDLFCFVFRFGWEKIMRIMCTNDRLLSEFNKSRSIIMSIKMSSFFYVELGKTKLPIVITWFETMLPKLNWTKIIITVCFLC